MMEQKLYCAIDLEFTGFDPESEEILEVGLVLFNFDESGARVVERWSQVFKPAADVHVKILALTGISQAEIDAAPPFSEFREWISEKIAGTVIVGHSVNVDIRFLEVHGVKVPTRSIDTLELVQWILPTYHSYNLENLTHVLIGDHTAAHRALGDAEASMLVMERLLRIYRSYSPLLRGEVLDFLKGFSYFEWQEVLGFELEPLVPGFSSVSPVVSAGGGKIDDVGPGMVLSAVRPGGVLHETLPQVLNGSSKKVLLLVEHEQEALKLWKERGFLALLSEEKMFHKEKFESLLKKSDLSKDHVLFLLKVLVWKHTNWQMTALFDLNVSFFGHQFLQLVGGKPIEKDFGKDSLVMSATYASFPALKREGLYKDRLLVCHDIQALERFLIDNDSTRVSWGYIISTIKSIYNPETDFGDMRLKEAVIRLLCDVDLFFGIFAVSLKRLHQADEYVSWGQLQSLPFGIDRLNRAAGHLAEKLDAMASKTGVETLAKASHALRLFFDDERGRIKWLEYGEHRFMMHNQPLDVADEHKNLFLDYSQRAYVNVSSVEKDVRYYAKRLNIAASGDRELLTGESPSVALPECALIAGELDDTTILQAIEARYLPLVVVFKDLTVMKTFYDKHFLAIKERANVYAQVYAGGSNKMLRNFGLKPNTVLLVTGDFLIKHAAKRIAPAYVLCQGLVLSPTSDPYSKKSAELWDSEPNQVQDYSTITALYDFERMINMIWSTNLKRVLLYGDGTSQQAFATDFFIESLRKMPYFREVKAVDIV